MFLANAQRSRAADAVTARCNSGFLRFFSGPVPADANAALSGNTLLAELTFGNPAFGAAVNGVATANAIGASVSNAGTGVPTFARAFEANGTTVVLQATASAVGGAGEAQIDDLTGGQIIAGGTCLVSSLVYTQPA